MKFRKESDSMGPVTIPSEMRYGASTQRAVQNFPLSERRFTRPFIQALGLIKYAAALANQELKKLPPRLAKTIASAALEVAKGKYDQHFPIDIFQTGSGTSTNMNANEVIANLAGRKQVHPNDHVNMGQSSNDVIPTAIHVAAALEIHHRLLPALKTLRAALAKKATQFKNSIKIGRTHLMDATPVTLGQEFAGYAEQIAKAQLRCHQALVGLTELAIGGTAVGTGINTHPAFARKVCTRLSRKTKIQFREAKNHFEAQGSRDACLFASGALKTIAVSLMKVANDLRWMNSGPRCGLGEIELPSLQPGSSIMPGKVNPVIPEAVTQISAQVVGNDMAITIGTQSGNFELNVMMPLIAGNLLESIELLANGAKVFAQKCIQGIKPNRKRMGERVEQSLAMVTALAPVIGYDQAAKIAKEAYRSNKTVREVLKAGKLLDEKRLDKLLDPRSMLKPKGG